MKHKFVTHQNCEIQNCMICDGGLAVCEVCGGAENTLTKECHSFAVTIEDFDELHEWMEAWKEWAKNQKDLSPEFVKIVEENFWELLA